jgi:Fe2+ transport system protein FeoA
VLTDLRIGETATLIALDLPESVQNFLMHMGFVPDAQVMALRRAPAGDPTVYSIDGMEIALRRETADAIRVRSSIENDGETSADRGKIDAEADRIAAKNDQIQREVHEFAGAIR